MLRKHFMLEACFITWVVLLCSNTRLYTAHTTTTLRTPGMATFSPSTTHFWLGLFEFPYYLESEETASRLEIYTSLLCQRQGQEVASRSRHLLLLLGVEKSHYTPWYIPEKYDDCVEEKELVLKQLCALLVSTYLHSPKK